MARFDVHRWMGMDAFVVDCQADLLADLPTRLVLPLLHARRGISLPRLNPAIRFRGEELFLMPQLATTVPITELSGRIGSLADHDYEITAAIDVLLSGV